MSNKKHTSCEIKIATLFSGIGAPEQGAMRVYDEVETVFACEFDKFARQSYSAMYDINEEHFHKDVNDMDATQYRGKVDILCGGSPCQSFSIAGLRKGTGEERGQLIYQYIRIVDECRPEVIIYENVKGMLSIDGGRTVKEFVCALRDIGYHCHYEVINTKHYGVPQNRERLFLVGFLDHDAYMRFEFAPKVPLTRKLKDVLEDDVDEKYFLSEKMIDGLVKKNEHSGDIKIEGTLDIKGNDQIRRVYDTKAISPTLTTMEGGNRQPKILDATNSFNEESIREYSEYSPTLRSERSGLLVKTATKTGYETATGGGNRQPKIVASRGRNKDNPSDRTVGNKVEQRFEVNENGTSNALTTVQKDNYVLLPSFSIRKLTPLECWRLQDFPDDAFRKSKDAGVSAMQLYKQAGNSMSVNVLEMIFGQIEKAKNKETGGLF